MNAQVVTVTDFKANSASYLEALEKDAKAITITRRGRPVAVLSSRRETGEGQKSGVGIGQKKTGRQIEILGDIVDYDTTRLYDCLK